MAYIEGQWEGALEQTPSETESSSWDVHLPDPFCSYYSLTLFIARNRSITVEPEFVEYQ